MSRTEVGLGRAAHVTTSHGGRAAGEREPAPPAPGEEEPAEAEIELAPDERDDEVEEDQWAEQPETD